VRVEEEPAVEAALLDAEKLTFNREGFGALKESR